MKSIDEALTQHFEDAGEQSSFGPLRVLIALSELAAPPATLPMRKVAVQGVVTKAKELAAMLNPAQKAKLDCLLLCVATFCGAALLPQVVVNDNRYKKSLGVTNMLKDAAIDRAKAIATELWEADIAQVIKLAMMVQSVWNQMIDEGYQAQLPDKPESIRKWIKHVAPAYARKAGRPRKTP
ncbi:hypothetical protein PMI26_00525 [Pseudomonas sp. GM33]|uniref:hypothetical protein n=1 Tax=Pseudomonas sp. GM33 TaxID=1144329 RepID=UPI00026FF0C9|nr:hypothetical protein [Pseudomonas sp. GM33]EJM48942.1 hypothetical protein PMI26_00525 [Pseudomonas sp. GM33]